MPAVKRKPTPAPAPEPTPETENVQRLPVPLETGLTAAITKSELTTLVRLAREDPRSLKKFADEAKGMVTLSEKTAAACVYALPRKEAGVTKMVRGPSVRFAEILRYAFRNIRVTGRIVEISDEFVTARGECVDLERNSGEAPEVPRKIVNRYGQRFSADMIQTTALAAIAIARRNAILAVIPQALWGGIYDAALSVIAGDAATLAARRKDALAYLARQGVTDEQVFGALGVRGVDDIGLEELTTLRGIANAIKDGETTIEEAFKPPVEKPTGVAGAKEMLQDNG